MIILSVDYGDARTGIAVCDKMEMLASPICVINESYAPKLAEKILSLIKEMSAEMLVVGLPKNMDGSEGERATKCKEFADLLREKSGIPVALYDERLTTVSAHRILSENNVRGKKRKSVVDAVSAVMILESFIASRKKNLS